MIKISIGEKSVFAELFAEQSPLSAQTLEAALPLTTKLRSHSNWSGRCSTFDLPGARELKSLESAVCSLYPGYLALRPDQGVVEIGYDAAELRSELGREYGSLVGRLIGDGVDDFLTYLDAMHYTEGDQILTITSANEETV
ncbi:hypothetical protein [Microvirga puerhi]|uniref:DUF3830 family protein n=1 Tax=Microvirga puerhi TaxID=2876078 RepID=A0ABS7VJL2_9HYPH|nr:hypothetical protein [Microvirga puerhi]MBZ6075716.1 hypothetical protein [Microvirga puerhi]